MISETLEPFYNAGMVVLLWGFVASVWTIAYVLIRENTTLSCGIMVHHLWEYAITGSVTVILSALTFIVFLGTLSIMGVV